jgi:membrane protease YdiL (CAAX protease family)
MTEIAAFLVLLFGITWPWGYFITPVAMAHGQLAFLAAFLPMVWMPTLIALALVRYTQGAEAVKRELRARLSFRCGPPILLLAGLTPLLVGAAAMGVARRAGDGAPFIPPTALAISIGIQIISGSTGEEIGWRGFLLPRLRARFGPAGGAMAIGLLWASWHVPAFYTPGMPHRFMPMWPMLTLIALFGVFLAALFYRGGDSVLPTMAAHISLNVILGIGGVNLASVVFWMTMAALTAPIAVGTMMWSSMRQGVRADRAVVG